MPRSPKPTPIVLEFDPSLAAKHETKPLRDGLSVAVRTGRNLWTASDETTTLERLTEVKPGRFAEHARFTLHDVLDLPGAEDEEVDIEGMGYEDGYLWLVGSHGLTRKKAKDDEDERENIRRLGTVEGGANRYLLARVPCVPDAEGDYALAREVEAPPSPRRARAKQAEGKEPKPVPLVAARLEGDEDGNALTEAIADDEHLAPFLEIPGKDNGFDIEGLAVAGDRLFVGMRGPVLRGWAVVLSLDVKADKHDATRLKLVEREVARTGKGKKVERCYARHFVNLSGMGIRELRAVGKDLLILAGPTMQLDGTIAVFRWKGGALADRDCIVPESAVERLFDVPHGTGPEAGKDKAEGMTLWPTPRKSAAPALLVLYDAPSDRRCRGKAGVVADLFPVPATIQREAKRAHPKRRKAKTALPVTEDDAAPGGSLTGRLMRKLRI
jgi:hypothetical protein